MLIERIFLVMNDIELMTKQKVSTVREEDKRAGTVVKMKHLLWVPWKAAGEQAASEQIIFQGKLKNPCLPTRPSFLPLLRLFPMDYCFHVNVFFRTLLTTLSTEVARKQVFFPWLISNQDFLFFVSHCWFSN